MSREQFSEKCDISNSFLTAVENGQKGVTSKTLYKICDSMNISADYLLFGKETGYSHDMIAQKLSKFDAVELESINRILTEILLLSR